MISVIRGDDVLRLLRESLNMPAVAADAAPVDDEFLAALLRRLAGFHCPCSPSTLRVALFQSLDKIIPDTEELNERVDSVLEALHAGGDLLELARVTTIDEHTRSTWVFIAPPSFVLLPSGVAHIFGLAPEETLPLPDSIRSRVRTVGTNRVLDPTPGEDLRAVLVDAAFREQSIDSWLRLPRSTTAAAFRKSRDECLGAAPSSGHIEQLSIYEPSRRERRYADRWVAPTVQTGKYIGRRPHAYGADTWGYVELKLGEAQRFLDFPLSGSTHRGCDEAWRLLLALENEAGHPLEYRLLPQNDGVAIDFFFPLPVWAQRRLGVVGRRIEQHHCLLSYWLPEQVKSAECEFIEQELWLRQALN